MMLKNTNYNPDVLTCLANLSNDEVFTPPSLVNQILDLLPMELWSNPDAKFLDPVCKSGVFLREMAKRLIVGLEPVFPDLQERANHIYRYQLFGLAITELTGLLSRRSVYCSKVANGRYSVCSGFEDEQGNIVYGRVEHDWRGGKCGFCGASQEVYERGDALESYAYQFIHSDDPSCFFKNMKFDVIVGNPPYQLSDGGAQASAKPLYHKFIEQAKKLNPRYLSMIVPSRWFSGGKGLDDFREEMLSDKRLTKVVDYFDSNECFPGVDISGGVCYFLWERDREKTCEITTIRSGEKSTMERPLLEIDNDSFIRFNEAISIYRKIKSLKEERFNKHISSRKPFGITTNAKGNKQNGEDTIKIFSFPENGFIKRNLVKQNESWINEYKVYISYAYGERGAFPYLVIGKPFLGEPNTCCTETYLVIRPFDSLQKCENVISYMRTRFFRFLVLLKKNTQHATSKVYSLVPIQDFNESWTDEKLYKKYGLTAEEITFIESMVRPMELGNE
ncbi:MAG: Eco57I restriction-modification methylase domain-containing protein [Pseudanabaena sp. M135S2SP2A07QC]|nr:Eco57I restriction-modification methylase domain-containing protein [Pseudanabaena sp. M090S1SP2A07QC]MCA6506847.1 Eco57I restriction-modification methylase domain-containing protein [Pseudanabaena sp. M172S2SP2A07QC]MCA6519885.1 Eco57I restriction-modification methylase domain-containing protein [Pseudanabaena sp. M110S1SP2A07QC]MCA6524277.1 Eco57I restriction-modification methylase domain-containing protein [Pseudanabaena sp. M051S1SP2A07QC]MCA6527773.1 Eco57I restriction-modification meth